MWDSDCGPACFSLSLVGWCLGSLVDGGSALWCWVSLGDVNASATQVIDILD